MEPASLLQALGTPTSLQSSNQSLFYLQKASFWNGKSSTLSRLKIICSQDSSNGGPKLVTFLGKGGSGKTITALLAAHHYAHIGLRTCMVVHSQEPTADLLLGQKLKNSPTRFVNGKLDVIRLESTKLLQEPLAKIRKSDSRLNFSQGALDEVVGEELSILPGMDAFLGLGAIEGLLGFAKEPGKGNRYVEEKYDIVVYDGLSSEDTLRLLGAAEKFRWYLRLAKNLAEKTDTGRVTAPSFLRLIEASMAQDTSNTMERTIAELWDAADCVLERISNSFLEPKKFACYLVSDPSNQFSEKAALRYWGCAMQAGAHVGGVFYRTSESATTIGSTSQNPFSPLKVANIPYLSFTSSMDWEKALTELNNEAKDILVRDNSEAITSPVQFNFEEQTVKFFLPGFEKSEIKLSLWRGGSALLLEVGDQRRVVNLPSGLRGKVSGAKFEGKSLLVSLKAR